MPECPKCGIVLGMHERGYICPKCRALYGWLEVQEFNGFDYYYTMEAQALYMELMGAGLLGLGCNRVEFEEGALIISRLDDIY